jgi:hypothetical protein
MKAGDSVMVLTHQEQYVTGFFRRYLGRNRVVVQVGGKDARYPVRSVFVLHWSGRLIPLKPKAAAAAKAKAKANPYDARKNQENQRLLEDVAVHGINVTEARLLTLDDFANGNTSCTNTLGAWMAAGGRAENVWVPNPDSAVVEAVRSHGGNGFQGTLEEYLLQVELPAMDVIYLDFCGFLNTHVETIKLLFSKGVVSTNKKKTLIHVTLCKREGTGTLDELHLLLTALCKEHLKSVFCFREALEHSSTMYKASFVIGRL